MYWQGHRKLLHSPPLPNKKWFSVLKPATLLQDLPISKCHSVAIMICVSVV